MDVPLQTLAVNALLANPAVAVHQVAAAVKDVSVKTANLMILVLPIAQFWIVHSILVSLQETNKKNIPCIFKGYFFIENHFICRRSSFHQMAYML